MVNGHLQRPGFCGPPKFRQFAAKTLAAKPNGFFATCSSTTYSMPLTAGHLQQNRTLAATICSEIGHLQLSLQMVYLQVLYFATNGLAASGLFRCK